MSDKKKKKAAAPAAPAPAASAPLSKKDAKTALETAKTNLGAFMKKNNLKEDSEPKDAGIASEFKALRKAVKAAKTAYKEAKGLGGGSSGRNTTYAYPEGMTDPKEKKKFRAKARAKAKAAAKGEAAPAEKKKGEAAPAAAPAAPAKKKKVKKNDD